MNFFKRAIKNVTRKLSKSVLLALTFFVIGNFVIVGLGVSNAAESAKVLTRQKMRAVVEYGVDYQAFWDWADNLEDDEERTDAYANYPYLKDEEIQLLLADERVKSVNALTSTTMYAEGITPVPLNNEYEQNNSGSGTSCYIDENGMEVCEEYVWRDPDLWVKGNSYPDMIEFADEIYKLVEGRFYTAEEIEDASSVCLITDMLADQNNLRIGDTITILMTSPTEIDRVNGYYAEMGLTREDFTMELEIIGIFDNTQTVDPTNDRFEWMATYESPENVVLIPDSVYIDMQYNLSVKDFEYGQQQFPDNEYYSNEENRPSRDNIMQKSEVTLLLNDPLEVDSFVEEYENNLTEEFRMLNANNETFEELARPLDTISLFANFIVWLVIINAVIIITLVTALTLKTREYEIGVLLSQGVSKVMVISQFFIELAIVAIIGFTVAVASGSMIASQVGQKVLEYQVDFSGLNEEETSNDYYISVWDDNYFTEVTLEDMINEYEVTISPLIIAEIYVAGLGIVLVSIIIPSMMVMRYNPKRILMSAQ